MTNFLFYAFAEEVDGSQSLEFIREFSVVKGA